MYPSTTLWKYTVREVKRRPGRTLLTLLGIVIGVAAVVAITAATRAIKRSYREMFAAVGGRAELEVVAAGQGGFDPKQVYQVVEQVPGVESAVGVIQSQAGLVEQGGITPVLVLGVDPQRDEAARDYRLRAGHGLDKDEGVLLEASFAEQHGYVVGDEVTLGAESMALIRLPVVGLLEPRGPALFNGGAVVLMRLSAAQRLYQLPDQVNSVQLVLEDDAEPRRIEEALAPLLPTGLRVQTPMARGAVAQESLLATDQALGALSVVSLVGGAFVILNSFQMNLGERRRQLAILRALGTTRGQVTRLLLREALLLGLAGAVLGMGVGVLLATGMVALYEQLLAVQLPPIRRTAEPLLLGLAFGPGMALAATVLPAWRAGRRSPLEAMLPRRSTPEPRDARPGWTGLLGVAMILAAGLAILGILWGWWGAEVSTALVSPTTVVLLVGCVLALPLVLGPMLRLTGRLLRPLLGAEGMLAVRQLQRQHGRTGLTVGVLFIGLIVTIGFSNSLLNNIDDLDGWYDSTVPADFFIRRSMPDSGTLTASSMPEEYAGRIEGLPAVAEVGRINFVPAVAQGRRVVVLARDFPPGRALPMAIAEGTEAGVRAGLLRGEVVLGTALAQRAGLGVGDTVTLQTRHGDRAVRVAGVVKEYSVGGMTLYLDWETADDLLDLSGVHAAEVYARPGMASQAEEGLGAFCHQHGLVMQTNAQLRAVVDESVAAVVGFMWVLIALVFVIASLGIVNTLTMNVHEQTHELGILRAIGLKRGQVWKLVVAQAVAMGLVSVVLGLVGGLKLAYVMNALTYPLQGHPIPFRLHPGAVLACAAVGLGVAVLASFLPARRAARLEVIQALHYE